MIVLLGAGTTGRVVARQLTAQGIPFVFADNYKFADMMEGVPVHHPGDAKTTHPDATWIATAIQPKFREELLAQIAEMGVKSKSLWEFMPKRHALPSDAICRELLFLVSDQESSDELRDQFYFRRHPSFEQRPASPISEIYFPDWIVRREDEHYVDCGAADGDTVEEFLKRWPKYSQITAFEPDHKNYDSFQGKHFDASRVRVINTAISDFNGQMVFTSTGDYSAHLGGDEAEAVVNVHRLDHVLVHPTYMKFDIEGSEPEALWGAREILKKDRPVLAVCAYHEAEHLWTLPLLIHALQPDYKLFLRRYAEGAWELCWYAVPPERVK